MTLEQVATNWVVMTTTKKKKQLQQQSTDGLASSSLFYLHPPQRDFEDHFNAISKIIADLIAESAADVDSIPPETTDDCDSSFWRRNFHRSMFWPQQLILAPVCAAHLSLGCFLRQFDVVQLRIEWLMNLNPPSPSSPGSRSSDDIVGGNRPPNGFNSNPFVFATF